MRGQFWIGVASNVVGAEVVAATVVLANQLSETGHPGHYHGGSYVLLFVFTFLIIGSAFFPLVFAPRDNATQDWVTDLSSNIVAAFVLLNAAAGFGALKGTALQVPSFIVQGAGALFAVSFASVVFDYWSLGDHIRRLASKLPAVNWAGRQFSVRTSTFPPAGWIAYGAYCIGVGLILLGVLQLSALAELLVIIFGAVLVLAGYLVVLVVGVVRWQQAQ